MIGLAEIEEIISLVLYSGYIVGETPVSVLLVSDVESGKSELVKQFNENDGIVFPHDATAWGITKHYATRIKQKKIRHIIFPEFIHCLSRQKETVLTLLAFLNGLIAEGVKEIHTYRTTFELKEPLSAGIILCVTTAEFNRWKYNWMDSGFLSRLLPISYSYSERVENAIFESIFSGISTGNPIPIALPSQAQTVILPDYLARKLKIVSKEIARTLGIRGFRPQVSLQRLAMAQALKCGRDKVVIEDIYNIQYLALEYFNLLFKEI